jgi:peptide/nickel transport system permease protein
LALPATIGAMGGWITYSRFVRAELLDALGQDFVRTADAKGLPYRAVLVRHALRNALMPLATMFGGILSLILSGSLLLEITFSWPGLGRLTIDAAYQRDYPLLMASAFLGSVLVILGYLLSDIAYAWVDPRVRYD